MKSARSKNLTLPIVAAVSAGLLAVFAFAPACRAFSSLVPPGLSEPENTARLVVWEAQVRSVLNVSVVVLQVAGVASLLLASFVPGGRLARRGRFGFVMAIIGLGIVGSLCAWYGSEFALFSGGSMAVLLNGAILGSESAHGSTTASGLLNDPEQPALAL